MGDIFEIRVDYQLEEAVEGGVFPLLLGLLSRQGWTLRTDVILDCDMSKDIKQTKVKERGMGGRCVPQ